LSQLTKGIEGHERWLGEAPRVDDRSFDIALSVSALECLRDEEVAPFLATLRGALRNEGHVVIAVPNNERLAHLQAVCPKTGVMFHSVQRLRAFDRASLRTLLAKVGFVTVSELEVELEEKLLMEHEVQNPEFASSSHAFVGAGTTLITVAQLATPLAHTDAQ
jgi:hypothetical protein